MTSTPPSEQQQQQQQQLLFDEDNNNIAEEVELPIVFVDEDLDVDFGAVPPSGAAAAAAAASASARLPDAGGSNVWELHQLYEHGFAKLSEKLFAKAPWPGPDKLAAAGVSPDPLFAALYCDLVFRHKHAKLAPSVDDRIAAYDNYVALFNLLLADPLDVELPNQWIWDIIDEFIYQFQAFRQFARKASPAEAAALKARPDVWNVLNVLNVLYSLVQKSTINEQLWVAKHGGDMVEASGTYGSRPLYRMLGYFSLVGLCRVHCLLGDYTMALKVLENIELNKKGLFARVTACHITTYYYVGFSYMMMRRWSDAIKAFTHILLFISRTKQYHSRSYQYEVIQKKGEQMYALLTICLALCPQRIDENVHSLLREKYGDQLSKLQKDGDESISVYEELFLFACPKFISPVNSDSTPANAAQQQQLQTFLSEVRQHQSINTIRSYLKLYTSLKIEKLASFVNKTPDELRTELLVYKHKTRQRRWDNSGSVLEGEYSSPGDLDFYIRQDMIHISESKVERRIGEWFVRQIGKFEDTIASLNRLG
ncbi:RNA polymerase I-associated factor PAF67-domain-containing protein [Obelidium mucronatum]|nr:RNA polymerase I-associated factor PAF67-domain-containing protein [Obelidium mucronatum]